MPMRKGIWVNVLLVAAMLCPTALARAEETATSMEDLMLTIESLKERVEQLETEKAASQPELVLERLDTMEEKLTKTTAATTKLPEDIRVYWKDGLRFDSQDGAFKLKLGGRIHLDFYGGDQSDELDNIFSPVEGQMQFRRLYLSLGGTVYEDFEFNAEYDFASGVAGLRDTYLAMNNIPYIGQIKVGHFKEPFSLEELTSDNNVTFVERSIINGFQEGRNTGIQLSNAHFGNRMTWAAGVFFDSDNFGNNYDSDRWNFTTRVTGLPWVEWADTKMESTQRFMHLGAAYTHREFDEAGARIRARFSAGFPYYGDTGTLIGANSADLFNFELALNYDRFSFQGEYTMADIDHAWYGTLNNSAWYTQASVFLTKDARTYKSKAGVIDKVKPKRNFSLNPEKRGPGAWEVALRYGQTDITDSYVVGGEMDDITIGLNWYLNPVARIMFNYDIVDIDRAPFYTGDVTGFKTRFQVAF